MIDLHPEHAKGVLEHLACGVVLCDTAGRVVWANVHALDLLGMRAEAMLGRRPADLGLPCPAAGTPSGAAAVRGTLVAHHARVRDVQGEGSVLLVMARDHALLAAVGAQPGPLASTTRMLSRAAIAHRLEVEISRSRRYANQLACIAVRIGGAHGPATLATLAGELKHGLRWVDVLGMWQDDALLIVLPETTLEAAGRLRDKLARVVTVPAPGAVLEWGVAAWQPTLTAEQVAARALARAEPWSRVPTQAPAVPASTTS